MAELEEEEECGGSPESLEGVFQQAAEWMRNNRSLKLTAAQKLSLYGLFKQGTEGPCSVDKPGIFDMTGRAKWDAWNKLDQMERVQAMTQYIELVKTLDPGWHSNDQTRLTATGETKTGGGGGGPVVSTLMNHTEVIPEENKNVFDWCKEGQVSRLAPLLSETNINSKDEQGMCLLHWACDRGRLDVVKLLVERGADVNQCDKDLQTPLHYAACCEHGEVVKYLLSAPGITRHLRDCDGATPAEVTSDPSLRALFID